MGNATVGPNKSKSVIEGENNFLRFACCEMQGWRDNMEDATLNIPVFAKESSLFGIFDGHGGPVVSKFVAANFEDIFRSNLEEINLNSDPNNTYSSKIENALIQTYLKLDELLATQEVNNFLKSLESSVPQQGYSLNKENNLNNNINQNYSKNSGTSNSDSMESTEIKIEKLSMESTNSTSLSLPENKNQENQQSQPQNPQTQQGPNDKIKKKMGMIARSMGTTANVLFIDQNMIYIANAGDSYSVMYKDGKAIKMNTEHKPSVLAEQERIYKAGLKIINNRVEGKLNLSRAIGDHFLKANPNLKPYEQAVTAYPEINKFKLTNDIEFIIMGCDGIWDAVNVQKFCDHISNTLKSDTPPKLGEFLEITFEQIVSKNRESPIGTDNMSCSLVVFKH